MTLEARVSWALERYATAKPADLAELIRELWEELHATQTAWGEQVCRLDTVIRVLEVEG